MHGRHVKLLFLTVTIALTILAANVQATAQTQFYWSPNVHFSLNAYDTEIVFSGYAYMDNFTWNYPTTKTITFNNILLGTGSALSALNISSSDVSLTLSTVNSEKVKLATSDVPATVMFYSPTPDIKYVQIGGATYTKDNFYTDYGEWQSTSDPDAVFQNSTLTAVKATSSMNILASFENLPVTPSVWDYSAKTGTWYMRSDTHTVNTVSGYKLSETQSATHTYDGKTKTGTYTTYYGVRVWIVFPNGQLEELTSGTPVAVVSRSSDGSGLQSANWTCPGYLNIVDAVMVKVYQRFSDETDWSLRVTFVTYNQTLVKLPESTWTFYYYTVRQIIEGKTLSAFYWGSSSYNSRVQFQYYEPNAWELMMYRLGQGDFIGFITFPYFNLVGNLFYGVLLLVVGATLYRRYESFVPIAIMMVLFGGVGGVVTMLVPAAGLHLAWLFMAFGLAILFFKLIRGARR